MEVGGWVQISLGIFFCNSSQNSSKKLCILSVYTLIKVVSYYDLSVFSIVSDGFPKQSLDGGWVGGVRSIQVFF